MKTQDSVNIAIATVSVVLGAILGYVVSVLFGPDSKLAVPAALVMAAVTCCLVASFVVLWYVPSMAGLAEQAQRLVDDALKYRAELIPREFIYPEMAKCIRNAKSEVAIITFFMYDWEKGSRTFLPPEQKIEGKDEFYEAIYSCIDNPSVEYVRVWQVPREHRENALEAIYSDPYYMKEIDAIKKVAKQSPDLARFVIEVELTTASFIFVDGKHLFFNVDFYDKERELWHSPCMIFVKDATEQAFAGLKGIIVRLTSRYEQ